MQQRSSSRKRGLQDQQQELVLGAASGSDHGHGIAAMQAPGQITQLHRLAHADGAGPASSQPGTPSKSRRAAAAGATARKAGVAGDCFAAAPQHLHSTAELVQAQAGNAPAAPTGGEAAGVMASDSGESNASCGHDSLHGPHGATSKRQAMTLAAQAAAGGAVPAMLGGGMPGPLPHLQQHQHLFGAGVGPQAGAFAPGSAHTMGVPPPRAFGHLHRDSAGHSTGMYASAGGAPPHLASAAGLHAVASEGGRAHAGQQCEAGAVGMGPSGAEHHFSGPGGVGQAGAPGDAWAWFNGMGGTRAGGIAPLPAAPFTARQGGGVKAGVLTAGSQWPADAAVSARMRGAFLLSACCLAPTSGRDSSSS